MFRFENGEYLYALLLIPLLVVFFMWMWYLRKRALERFGNSDLVPRLIPQLSKYKHAVKYGLMMLGIAFLIIAWANPQWGTRKEKVKQKSADIFIAIDISQSMMSEDIRPSRMDRARKFAQKLIQQLKGERIGTIIFAGNAYLQMPLTSDYSAALMFVKSANPRQAPTQGTAIGDAIELAETSFEQNNKHHKAMVIITDGEDHDSEALAIAEKANENGLLIFTIGVGTQEGGVIPVNMGGRLDLKRDKTGNPIRTKLNEDMLKKLAAAGEGTYFNLTDGDKIAGALQESLEKVEKREIEQRMFNEFESYFQYFLAIGLFFLVIEFLISYQKNKWLAGKDFFKN